MAVHLLEWYYIVVFDQGFQIFFTKITPFYVAFIVFFFLQFLFMNPTVLIRIICMHKGIKRYQ